MNKIRVLIRLKSLRIRNRENLVKYATQAIRLCVLQNGFVSDHTLNVRFSEYYANAWSFEPCL